MKQFLVSVITPSYNQAEFLEQTIKSVLNQNYPMIEYIIIDGGSTDGSVEIIKKYESNIHYWISEKDNGQSHAINKGIKIATGDIVCWLNSDDLFESNTLHTIAKFFNENLNAKFVYGDGVIFYENKLKTNYCKPGNIDKYILSYCDPLQQPSTFWHRSIHNEVGFLDESLFYTMDWDFFMRIALKYDMYYLPISFSKYRVHEFHKTGVGGENRNKEIVTFVEKYSSKEWIDIFKQVYPFANEIRQFRQRYGWRLGRLAFYLKHPKLFYSNYRKIRTVLNMF